MVDGRYSPSFLLLQMLGAADAEWIEQLLTALLRQEEGDDPIASPPTFIGGSGLALHHAIQESLGYLFKNMLTGGCRESPLLAVEKAVFGNSSITGVGGKGLGLGLRKDMHAAHSL